MKNIRILPIDKINRMITLILLNQDIVSVTKYWSEKLIVRAVRRIYKRSPKLKGLLGEILVSITRPNYKERKFIKLCKKAGERFPVRNLQIKYKKEK